MSGRTRTEQGCHVAREGGYLLLVDRDGLRHAVRPGALLCLSDADPTCDATIVQLSGGRALVIPVPLEDLLGQTAG